MRRSVGAVYVGKMTFGPQRGKRCERCGIDVSIDTGRRNPGGKALCLSCKDVDPHYLDR